MAVEGESAAGPVVLGRYAMFDEFASGGMAAVHFGRVLADPGRGDTVAIKRLRRAYATNEDFVTMFLDEARIVGRINHPNVVATTDVLRSPAGMFLVMEYVHGETFSRLLRAQRARKELVAPAIAVRVVHDALLGLHGAHETRDENGVMLNVVHRDVSPQNVMVGVDGTSRVLDFGVAKAVGRAQVTREGEIKGKLTYMAPEQVRGQVDRRTDVFAAAVVLWEALAGRRLHEGLSDVEIVSRVVKGQLPPPSTYAPEIPPALDEVVMRGLSADPNARHADAESFARALAEAVTPASSEEVGAWASELARAELERRAALVDALAEAAKELVPSNDTESLVGALGSSPDVGADISVATEPFEFTPPEVPTSSPEVPTSSPEIAKPSSEVAKEVRPGADLRPYLALVIVCALIALVGAGLGAYAFFGAPSGPPPRTNGASAR